MPRGGAQVIPRPDDWRPGGPAPWPADAAELITLDRIRAAFAGRVGRPAVNAKGPDVRRFAVLASWYEHQGELYVLCTRRAQRMRLHRGEVSFPGGGEEPDDESLLHAALREAWEEVRLPASAVEVLGEMDHMQTYMSDRFIVPFVGLLDGRPDGLVAQESEVEEILHVPLSALLDPEAFREEWWPSHESRPLTFFEIEGDTIWGATGHMLRHFLDEVLGQVA